MGFENVQLRDVQRAHEDAGKDLAEAYGDRVDPLKSTSHPDHWLADVPHYIAANLADGSTESTTKAQELVNFWLSSSVDGRIPHMILDGSWTHRQAARVVQQASALPDGRLASPFSGPPVLSSCAWHIAENLTGQERTDWINKTLPALVAIKDWQYREREIYGDGSLVQIHPDEVTLRNGNVSGRLLDSLPGSKLTDLEIHLRNAAWAQHIAKSYRHWQADDQRRDKNRGSEPGTYNSDNFMELSDASRVYTLWATTRRNDYNARRLANSRGRDDTKDGYIVQDVAITGMLLADNQALENMAQQIDYDLPPEVTSAMARTRESISQHWDAASSSFVARSPQWNIGKDLAPPHAGIEQYLLLSGGTALNERDSDFLIKDALRRGEQTNFAIPTAWFQDPALSNRIDRGAFSPSENLAIFTALEHCRNHNDVDARLLYKKIGSSIIAACTRSGIFSRQYDSRDGTPIGQRHWRITSAAAFVVSAHLLS